MYRRITALLFSLGFYLQNKKGNCQKIGVSWLTGGEKLCSHGHLQQHLIFEKEQVAISSRRTCGKEMDS